MKQLILCLVMLPCMAFAQQLRLADDFESGTLGGWDSQSLEHWEASDQEPLNGSYALRQMRDDALAGTDILSYPINIQKLSERAYRWRFSVRHGYDPSASNHWAVYLAADSPADQLSARGYVLGVNLKGYDDSLRLWKCSEGQLTELLNTGINWQQDIGKAQQVGIEVLRSRSGSWVCSLDADGGFDALEEQGRVTDTEFDAAPYLGLFYTYTKSGIGKFWVDDVEVVAVNDLDSRVKAPAVQVSAQSIDATNSTPGTAVEVLRFELADAATADGLPTVPTRMAFKAAAGNTADWAGTLQAVLLKQADRTVALDSFWFTDDGVALSLASDVLSVPDGESLPLSLWVFVSDTGLVDGAVLQFEIAQKAHGFSADLLGSEFAPAFVQGILSAPIMVQIEATKIQFASIGHDLFQGREFAVRVLATDAFGNPDINLEKEIRLFVHSGTGSLQSHNAVPLTAVPQNGAVQWDALTYDSSGSLVMGLAVAGFPAAFSVGLDVRPSVSGDYYEAAKGLSGSALKLALHRIIRGHRVFSYADAWDALPYLDADPSNADNVVLIYTGRSQPSAYRDRGTGTTIYESWGITRSDSWNREHVWSKSHGFSDEADTAYTDLHNLRPADQSVNSSRSNKDFDVGGEAHREATACASDADSWEPRDAVKGDIARILFYMATRYENSDYDLELLDRTGTSLAYFGKLSALLSWHRQDPVDEQERIRNEKVFLDYQGNRNPYVDHPEFVEAIWSEQHIDFDSQLLPAANAVPAASIASVANRRAAAVDVLRVQIADQGTADTLPTVVSQLVLEANRYLNTANWASCLAGIRLRAAGRELDVAELSIGTKQLTAKLVPGALQVPNGQRVELTVSVYLKSNGLHDGDSLAFFVDRNDCGWDADYDRGSYWAAKMPEHIYSELFIVDVAATQLSFDEVPEHVGAAENFKLRVSATDANGNVDSSFSQPIKLKKRTGKGDLQSPNGLQETPRKGTATWQQLRYINGSDIFSIEATTPGLPAASSGPISAADVDGYFGKASQALAGDYIPSVNTSAATAAPLFRFTISDAGTRDGLPTKPTHIKIKNAQPVRPANWRNTIAGIVLCRNTDTVPITATTITDDYITANLAPNALVVDSGQTATLTVSVYLVDNSLVDGQNIQFFIDGRDSGWGFEYASSLVDGSLASVYSAPFSVDVTATQLYVGRLPAVAALGEAFGLTVTATDTNLNIDRQARGTVQLSATGGRLSASVLNLQQGYATATMALTASADSFVTIKAIETKNKYTAATGLPVFVAPTQWLVQDDFEDEALGDWLPTRAWEPVRSGAISGAVSLRHSLADSTAQSYASRPVPLAYPLSAAVTQWNITLKNDHFDPGSSLGFSFCLAADVPQLSSDSLNGYFVGVNHGGATDRLSLWEQSAGRAELLMETGFDWDNNEAVAIQVSYRSDGLWTLGYSSLATDTLSYINQQKVHAAKHGHLNYCGVYFRHASASNAIYHSGGLWADNLVLRQAKWEQPAFVYSWDGAYRVVFNEIMAEPDTAWGLPAYEYVELYNRSNSPISLGGWTLGVGSNNTCRLGQASLPANGYLVLCSATAAAELAAYGPALGVAGFPVLTNAGQQLWLTDALGQAVSAVEYSDAWYGSAFKAAGGYSLELIDADNAAGGAVNWTASVQVDGGTPGQANSVQADNPDWDAPQVLGLGYMDGQRLRVYFSEPITLAKLAVVANYKLSNGVGVPASAMPVLPMGQAVDLHFAAPLGAGAAYGLALDTALTDVAGNALTDPLSLPFALPVSADSFAVVINELLFDPLPGGADYVELYNRSQRCIDLSQLYLCSRAADGSLGDKLPVCAHSRLLPAGAYVALTVDRANTLAVYAPQDPLAVMQVTGLPLLPDDAGTLVLTDIRGRVVDQVAYSAKMHFGLLDDAEGVALERIHPDAATGDGSNWQSAAYVVGYGTPGYQNSQYSVLGEQQSDVPFRLEREVFSPDGDGVDDALELVYRLEEPGCSANIRVFDMRGRRVRMLANNRLLGTEGVLRWDGLDDAGQLADMGIHIIFVELYNLQGTVKSYKLACVVARRL